jgi:hypothetical protein
MPTPGVHQLKYAKIDCASATDNAIVAAVTDKRITVCGYAVVADAAVDAKFRSGTTDLTGPLGIAANGGVSYAGGPHAPAFQTAKGAALNLNLGGAVQASGHVTYLEEG